MMFELLYFGMLVHRVLVPLHRWARLEAVSQTWAMKEVTSDNGHLYPLGESHRRSLLKERLQRLIACCCPGTKPESEEGVFSGVDVTH